MVNPVESGAYSPLYNPRQNDIFISYAEADIGFVKRLDAAIRQTGRDPWVDWDDIPIEADEWEYIETGVKEVDSFIFVISPDSATSEKNRAELDLAIQFGKQIIPILWREVEPTALPEFLQDILPISARRGNTVAFERLAKKIFYMHTHARLQTRTSEWERSGKDKNLLLSFADLEAIDRWKTQNSNREFQLLLKQLTPLQKEFLEESQKSRYTQKSARLEFFISYSRRDKEFVRKLYNRLKEHGTTPWIDWENIPVATDWQQEIYQGIEGSHTVLFVLSYRSLESEFCFKEIAHAVFCGRRIIPIVFLQNPERSHRTVEVYEQELIQKLQELEKDKLLQELKRNLAEKKLQLDAEVAKKFIEDTNFISRYQTVRFGYEDRFEEDFQALWQTIGIDLALVEQHADLERKAQEWDDNKRHPDLLEDRSKRLREAEKLLQQCESKEIHITPLQQEYIHSSREARNKKKTIAVAAVLSIVTLIGTAIIVPKLGEVKALVSSLEDRKGLDALLVALKTGKEMQSGGWLYRYFAPELPVRTITALQQEINQLREINRLEDHKGRVYQVSFSPDGNLIASASEDRTVKLWQVDGKLVDTFFGHTDAVVSIAFNPGSRDETENGVRIKRQMLASGSYDRTIKLWQIDTYLDGKNKGQVKAKLFKTLINNGHTDRVYSVASDPGGTMLASASSDGTVKLWTWQGELLRTLVHGKAGMIVTGVSFSPYGDEIATAGTDGTVKRWTKDGKLLATLSVDSAVLSLSYSPDGKLLAFGDTKGTLKLWRADNTSLTLQKHEGAIRRITFSPDGQIIATASDDGTVRLWNQNGSQTTTLRGHQGAVYRVQFSPDGRTIATAGVDGIVRLWTVNGTLLDSLEGHRDEVLSIDFSPPRGNQAMIASASADSTIKLWKMDSPVKVLPHGNRVYDVVFRPNDSILASASWQTIRLWGRDGTLISSVTAHQGIVSSLNFSSDKGLLASAGTDSGKSNGLINTIKLWRLGGSKISQIATLAELDQRAVITGLQFVPNHPLLASVSEDGGIRFWRYLDRQSKNVLSIGEPIYVDQRQGQLTNLSISPDGTLMVTTSKALARRNGLVKLWKLEYKQDGTPTVTLLKTIEAHQGDVLDVSFSPDGKLFATAGTDQVIRLWGQDGTAVRILPKKHQKPITSIRFSPDGKLLASASQDGEIKLWTIQGQLITTLKRHHREVSGLSFSSAAGSNILASASYDNQVLLWKLPDQIDQKANDELLSQGCEAAQNYLNQNPKSLEIKNFCQQNYWHRPQPANPDIDSWLINDSLEAMQRGN